MTGLPTIKMAWSRGAAADLDRPLATACFAIASLVGLAFAFVGLDARSFWFDEFFTRWLIEPAQPTELIGRLATDVHPPLYYVSLWLWSRMAGDSDSALRGFSALSAVAGVAIFVAGTARSFSLPARLFGVALAVSSLYWFFQSQNVRSNALCLPIMAAILVLSLRLLAGSRHKLVQPALWAAMLVGSFVHFYGLYVSLAALVMLALLRPTLRWRMAVGAAVLAGLAGSWLKLVVEPNSQANLAANWIPNDPGWYLRVLESCWQYALGLPGTLALALCAAVALACRRNAPPAGKPALALADDSILLLGVPLMVLLGGIASSIVLSPNVSDRNLLLVVPFLWAGAARLYDVAVGTATRPLRIALNAALAIATLSMATMAAQRLPSANPPLLYEPYRSSAAWIRTLPQCRGATLPVLATDPERYYRPGFARTLIDYSYASALEGFAIPRTIFLEDLLVDGWPADLGAELRSRLEAGSCPVLLWSVHNITPGMLTIARQQLALLLGPAGSGAMLKTQAFRDGQPGYVLYLDRAGRRAEAK